MRNVIITGATGSVGVALVERLIKENIKVSVICRENGRIENIPKSDLVSVIYCDLCELKELDVSGKYDTFYHLGWTGTTGTQRDDTDIQLKNIKYTLDAVELAKRLGCSKFIGTGSQAEYGLSDKPLKADTLTNPFSGYGMAKLAAGQLSRLRCNQLDISHTWVRILSVFGKYDSEKSIIKYSINTFKNHDPASFSQGTQIWDFLYADDAAQALYLVGINKKSDNKTYVLGSGIGKPLRAYIEEIYTLCNSTSEISFGNVPFSKNSVMFLQADISDLKNDCNFEPKFNFSEGIKKLLENED